MVNRNEVEQRWKQRGFSCDLWIDPPGATWEGTIHGVDEVFMVVRGQMELEIGGEITHPEIGEEVSIPAGTRPCSCSSAVIVTSRSRRP